MECKAASARVEEQPNEHEQEATCRLCWCPADEDSGGILVSPCSCSGTSKWIHERCLELWKKTLRRDGNWKRSRVCEVCKSPYHAPVPQYPGPPLTGRRQALLLLGRVSEHVLEACHSPSWPILIYRCWRTYLFATGVYHAARTGSTGLQAGVRLGKTLITEQTTVMIHLLSTMAEIMGSPYAELLWGRSAATVLLGLASEFVYTSILGLVGGLIYGFASGYAGALRASLQLVARGAASGASAALRLGVKALRLIAALPGARMLRMLILTRGSH